MTREQARDKISALCLLVGARQLYRAALQPDLNAENARLRVSMIELARVVARLAMEKRTTRGNAASKL